MSARFTYEGVMAEDALPDYMDDLAGCHAFRMIFRMDGSERERQAIIQAAQFWCMDQGWQHERMSNQFFFRDDFAALAFRVRWC